MSTRHNARKAAVQALYQYDLTGQAANEIEANFAQIHDLLNVDKRYLRRIVDGVTGAEAELTEAIEPHIERSFTSLDPVEKAILRVGAYEILFVDDVPPKVTLNEMIEIAKVFGADHSYKFINGVMDKIARAHSAK